MSTVNSVPKLRVARTPPNHFLADRLRGLLALVESGEVQSLAWVGEHADGGTRSGHEFAPGATPARIIGEVALLGQRLGLAELQRREEIERR